MWIGWRGAPYAIDSNRVIFKYTVLQELREDSRVRDQGSGVRDRSRDHWLRLAFWAHLLASAWVWTMLSK